MVLAAMVFVGIGNIAEKVAADFKSDEKALAIIKNARIAIGGDAAIGEVKSMVIKGQTSKTLNIDGVERIEQGETEIAFENPGRLMKMVKLGNAEAGGEGKMLIERKVDVVVVGKNDGPAKTMIFEGKDGEFVVEDGSKVIARKVEGTPGEAKIFIRKKGENADFVVKGDGEVKEVATADGKQFTIVRKGEGPEWTTAGDNKIVMERTAGVAVRDGHQRDNELLRTMLGLLLTAPEGMDVAYTFAGETDVDGTAANAVDASFGGSSVKLFFDRSTNLPLGMSFVGNTAPIIVKMKREGAEPVGEKRDLVLARTVRDDEGVATFVRFADYRSTNGVQLPYRWTTSLAGKQSEVFEVASYDVNPANISERFKAEGVMIRVAKPAEVQK